MVLASEENVLAAIGERQKVDHFSYISSVHDLIRSDFRVMDAWQLQLALFDPDIWMCSYLELL